MTRTIAHGEPLPERAASDGDRTIDGYRLVRRIGEGGMGEVWLAEQATPVRREVALKLVKAGMDTRRVIARFEAERQALAVMQHPAIASILDAGSTSDGQPYFVMEYVDGRPVTEYAAAGQATLHERLDLFIEICRGVQHAHHKGVIHRDLKPSNLLVTTASGRPQPKIIDFGIAKALEPSLGDVETTESGTLLGTPEYMSPEQADSLAGARDIDTRSDVYSLGVVLYELLAGALPFTSQELRTGGLANLRHIVREVDPRPPSTRLEGPAAATLRGDLDAIVMRALEKDRGERYGSPTELADDLGRYLASEPVHARPQTLGYRVSKYARRHRAGVIVGTAAAALLLGFTVVLAVEVRAVSHERDRANREAAVSQRVLDFMLDMFEQSDPDRARGSTIPARTILDRASTQIASGLATDPEIQARMMGAMARVYDALGIEQSALPLAVQALAIELRTHGAEDRETLRAQTELAMIERDLGNAADAEKRLRDTVAIARRTLGERESDTLNAMFQLAAALDQEGHSAEAEQLLREVVAARRREVDGDRRPETFMAMTALASTLSTQKKYDEAEQLLRDGYALERAALGSDHPVALASLHNLGSSLSRSKHFAEAERVNREVVETSRRILGPEHPETLGAMNNLAFSLSGLHRLAEAEPIMLAVLAGQRHVLPPDHPRTALTLYNLACLTALQGRRADALAYLRESFDHGMPGRIAKTIGDDADLASLRGDPAFDAIAAAGRQRGH